MKIISPEIGKVTRLYVADEIKPIGGIYLPDLLRLIGERYSFATIPTVQETQQRGGHFGQGRLITNDGEIVIGTLGTYNDGAMVTCQDTDLAEIVLEDFIQWARATFGLREPITKAATYFESNLVVEFSSPAARAMRGFERMKKLYEEALRSTYEQDIPVHFSTVGIGADPLGRSPLFKPDFGMARRVNRPYSEDRYFAIAPLRTAAHIELLEAFEREILT